MRFIDIRNNNIVLRFLDNIIVSSGYKFSLEIFGIEDNKKKFEGKKGCCSKGSNKSGLIDIT